MHDENMPRVLIQSVGRHLSEASIVAKSRHAGRAATVAGQSNPPRRIRTQLDRPRGVFANQEHRTVELPPYLRS